MVLCLWKQDWHPVQCTLLIDVFGIKYDVKEHALHLKQTLENDYPVTTEWDGKRYIGITLDCDYKRQQFHLSMPGYVKEALKKFRYVMRKEKQQPFPSVPIKYGAKEQYATQESTSPPFDKNVKKIIQQVCGNILFLG